MSADFLKRRLIFIECHTSTTHSTKSLGCALGKPNSGSGTCPPPGGYVCMTTRANQGNLEYKAALERELRLMEEEGLWSAVEVTEEREFERAMSEHEEGYITGHVYLYMKTSPL